MWVILEWNQYSLKLSCKDWRKTKFHSNKMRKDLVSQKIGEETANKKKRKFKDIQVGSAVIVWDWSLQNLD
mgnify:CR=1 FL=1